jgi:hypothetical protein
MKPLILLYKYTGSDVGWGTWIRTKILGVRVHASDLISHSFFSKWVVTRLLFIKHLRSNFKTDRGPSSRTNPDLLPVGMLAVADGSGSQPKGHSFHLACGVIAGIACLGMSNVR